MRLLAFVCFLLAFVCFLLATAVPVRRFARVNLVAAGLAAWVLYYLVVAIRAL